MNRPASESVSDGGNVRVAALQMVSTPRVEENLKTAAGLVAQAVAQGAQLVALPEYFPIMGLSDADKFAVREVDGQGAIQDFLAATARKHGIWLVGGSLPLVAAESEPCKRRTRMTRIGLESEQGQQVELLRPPSGRRRRCAESPSGGAGSGCCSRLRSRRCLAG